jgi:hypothetical protein
LILVHPDAVALKASVQDDSAGVAVIEMLHSDARALGTIQFVMVVFLGGKDFLVHPLDGSDFIGRKNLVVVLENPLEFSRGEPLAHARGASHNLLAIGFNNTEGGLASGAIHDCPQVTRGPLRLKSF